MTGYKLVVQYNFSNGFQKDIDFHMYLNNFYKVAFIIFFS